MNKVKWNLFGKIWIHNVGDIDFEMIFAIENLNKFQKTKFGKEKSIEDQFTLSPKTQATLVHIKFKK